MALLCLLSVKSLAVGFLDQFNSIDPGWVTDRYAPAGFNSVAGNLEITISDTDSAANRPSGYSSAFYNTQGRQRDGQVTGQWTLVGDINVGSDVGGNNLRRADLWGRTGNVGTETGAAYFILGYRNFDPNDVFNPSAPNITSAWRVWDEDTANGWVDLATPVTAGWHNVSIHYTGAAIQYILDGNLVYTDNTINALSPQFTTVFAQAYNFGAGGYTALFDNIGVSVPDAGSTSGLMMAGIGFLTIFGLKRRL